VWKGAKFKDMTCRKRYEKPKLIEGKDAVERLYYSLREMFKNKKPGRSEIQVNADMRSFLRDFKRRVSEKNKKLSTPDAEE
jgi:hypothetical protein